MAIITTLSVLGVIAGLLYALLTIGSRDRRYPPGPPTLPFLGNLHQLPTKGAHFKLTEFARSYGGLYTLKLGTGTAIVITDRRIVKELLDKRSSVSSGRPRSHIALDIVSQGDHILFLPYGPRWRSTRKLIHQFFMESMCDQYHLKVQHAEAVQMLRDLVVKPEQHMLHAKRFSNSVITSVLFGVRASTCQSDVMVRLYEIMDHFTKLIETGATPPLDIYPFLKYIPERFLGKWLSRANGVKHKMNSLYQEILQHIIRRREIYGSKDSFIDRVLDSNDKTNLTPHQIAFLGGVIMEGGSDTTASAIVAFIQAMTKWPQIQREAQMEIDAVIGEDRSPNWSDYNNLPYVAAIVKETMRWRPVTPLGVPHTLEEDEWIDGKLLPKGATLILNVWGLQHDAKKYINPGAFDPERYAGNTLPAADYANSANYEDRDHYGYGAGRRLCPGIHMAERNLFLGISMLLWAFNFEKEIDPITGKPLEPDSDPVTGYIEGIVSQAKPFPCKVLPRSQARHETIIREFAEAETEIFAKYDISLSRD